ncbi:hypothetical protein SAMN05192562_101263 [Kosakonia arachidis]|uniref:Uncharacterized protein n=1 Tax=Kosakonia arachidis TaxID=551989 RepID=A0A1I6XYU2_9ENTR|nr:hypothetical protein SAMN05192562_101263 [Kosakonia arachidis]
MGMATGRNSDGVFVVAQALQSSRTACTLRLLRAVRVQTVCNNIRLLGYALSGELRFSR